MIWWKGRNEANPGMVPPRGKGSDNRSKTHGGDALSGGSGCGRIQHAGESGSKSRSKHGGNSSGCKSRGDGSKARVGAASKGRRRLPHSGLEAVSSTHLHHGWVGEGAEMERRGRRRGLRSDLE